MKGSQRKASSEQIELRNLIEEFTEKLEHDPYQPGMVHPNLGTDDLQEIAEDALFVRDFSEVVIRVKKQADNFSIVAEVISRK
jgi:hypothetical protein